MNRLKELLSSQAAAMEDLVNRGDITQERARVIAAGEVKLTPAEAKLIGEASVPMISPELLIQLNADDLASGKKKAPMVKTSKSPSVPIGPHGRRHDNW